MLDELARASTFSFMLTSEHTTEDTALGRITIVFPYVIQKNDGEQRNRPDNHTEPKMTADRQHPSRAPSRLSLPILVALTPAPGQHPFLIHALAQADLKVVRSSSESSESSD